MAAKAAIGATCRAMSISTRPTSPTGSTPCLHLGEFHDDRPAEHDRSRVGRARHAGADDDGRGTRGDRKSDVKGKSVSVRVALGGRRSITQQKKYPHDYQSSNHKNRIIIKYKSV